MCETGKWEANRNEIFDEYGTLLARCCDDEFDNQIARKIVRAVNCHDVLLCHARELLEYKKWVKASRDEIDDIEDTIAEAEGGGNG